MKYKLELKNIHKLAYPILLNYLLASVFVVLDKAIVGHYSLEGFAVVGIGADIIFTITGTLGALAVAFNIIAAEAKGKQKDQEFEKLFVVSKGLAWMIGIFFLALSILGGEWFFEHIYHMEGKALAELMAYFYPASITVLQNILFFQFSVYFRNKENTRISLYVNIISTVVNLFFDYVLVYGIWFFPELGVAGAAWGSVIGLIFGLIVYQMGYYGQTIGLPLTKQLKIFARDWRKIKAILRLYPALLGQEMMESTVLVLVITGAVTQLGVSSMASYNLLQTVVGTIGLPVYAYATASQTYALQNYSAGNHKLARRYLKLAWICGSVWIIVLCLGLGIFSDTVFHWIIAEQSIIDQAKTLLIWIGILLLVKIPYQIYMSFLQGIGKEKQVFVTIVIATVIISGAVMITGKQGLEWIYLSLILGYAMMAGRYVVQSRKIK